MTDKFIKQSVRQAGGRGSSVVVKQLAEIGEGVYADVVSIGGAEGDINLNGDVIVDTLGALDDSKELDPDAGSATLPALARGQLSDLNDIVTATQQVASTVSNIAKQWSVQTAVCYNGTVMNPAHEETLQAIGLQMADVVTATERLANVVSSIAKSDSLQVGVFYSGSVINPSREETLQDISDGIGRSDDSAGDPTVIGLLKQIMANTSG